MRYEIVVSQDHSVCHAEGRESSIGRHIQAMDRPWRVMLHVKRRSGQDHPARAIGHIGEFRRQCSVRSQVQTLGVIARRVPQLQDAGIAAGQKMTAGCYYFEKPTGRWLPPFFALLFAFVGLVNAGLGFSMGKSKARADFQCKTGLRGSARILSVRDTGVTINDSPRVECTLQVSLPGEAGYTCSFGTIVPLIQLGRLTSPAPVAVRVNPAGHQDIFAGW